MNKSIPVMRIDNIDKSFGGLHAVNSVSFDVGKGIIKSVIGPNGAGKTTMFNMIAGYETPSGGEVFFEDTLLTGKKPWQVAEQGVLRTFQNLKLSNHMTVLDNVLLGWHSLGSAGFLDGMFSTARSRREEKKAIDAVLPILEWLNIINLKDSEVGNLSFGNQRAVELARALVADPSILLLDEPAAVLICMKPQILQKELS